MNIWETTFNLNTVNQLITRARRRRNLSDTENGLLNVAENVLARAEHGADAETVCCIMAMAERIEAIMTRESAEVIDLIGYFHKSVAALAPKLNRRWDSQTGIERRAA